MNGFWIVGNPTLLLVMILKLDFAKHFLRTDPHTLRVQGRVRTPGL